MSKKVLILNGSPRRNGNTEALIDNFIKGAEEAGHVITKFDIRKMNIHPCIGCLKGGADKESPCVQKDDMDKIYPVFKEADILVFASPLYFWSFSAQLKMTFDRLFAPMEAAGYQETPHMDCMMLIAAEEDTESNFAPIIHYYESLVKNMGWSDIGKVLAGGVFQLGDIKGHPALEDAKKLGASIV